MVESCYRDGKKQYLNLIIDWSIYDVWEFIKKYNIPYCKLYDEGWERIGCLMCPMSGKRRVMEAERYPKYKKAFILNFKNYIKRKKQRGKHLLIDGKMAKICFTGG